MILNWLATLCIIHTCIYGDNHDNKWDYHDSDADM